MNTKTYVLKTGKSVAGMAHEIEDMLSTKENMDTQILTMDDKSVIIQGRIRGAEYKKLAGMDRAITVRIIPVGQTNATVEIAHGKWLNKSAAMVTSLFILWPLAVTSAYSFYKQYKLPEKILNTVEKYLSDKQNEDAA